MRNWDSRDEYGTDGNGKGCEWEEDWEDVRKVSHHVGIPCEMVNPAVLLIDSILNYMQVDLTKEYWNRVFDPALHAWSKGRTPNPDVSCNRFAVPLVLVFTFSDISM